MNYCKKHTINKKKSAIVLKKRFASEPVYNKKYSKTKLKAYKSKINTSFCHNGMPKEGSYCVFFLSNID